MSNFSIFCAILAFVTVIADGLDACSDTGSYCSCNEDCCPISNGKSYCNGESGQCDTVRFCDESSPHTCPFNDLSPKEIARVIKIIKENKDFGAVLEFPIVRKQEPKKKLWNSGDSAAKERIAYAVVFDISNSLLSELLISLKRKRIISNKKLRSSVALMTSYDYDTGDSLYQNDERVKKAYKRRGLNISYAAFDHWASGSAGIYSALQRSRYKVLYGVWRPVEGLLMTIDVAARKIISFVDKYIVPVPQSPLSADDMDHLDQGMPSVCDPGFRIAENDKIGRRGINTTDNVEMYAEDVVLNNSIEWLSKVGSEDEIADENDETILLEQIEEVQPVKRGMKYRVKKLLRCCAPCIKPKVV